MPISVFCLGCGKRFKAKDALAGKTVPCPVCGEKISIGAAPVKWKSEGELLRAEAAPSSEPAPAPKADPVARSDRNSSPERRSGEISGRETRPPAASRPPAALRLKGPPPWLRHLHWLLVLSLIPLAISLLQSREREDFVQRLIETLADSPGSTRLGNERWR